MLPLIERHRREIAEVCDRFRVQRLDVFGSASRGIDFDPDRSDVDFLVTWQPDEMTDIASYLDLRDALASLLGHPVDLVMENAIENPFVRAGIERSRQTLYAA